MKHRQTVIVLGAGIAGLRCALDLADRIGSQPDIEIILVNRTRYHTLHSTLYETVTAENISDVLCLPIDDLLANRSIHFIQDSVTRIDPIHQKVSLRQSGTLRYDYLVLALGNTPKLINIPGLVEHASLLNTFEDAISLRQTLRELAMHNKKIRVVIGGGGAVGCELAATLAYFAHELCEDCDRCEKHLDIDLIEKSGRLLSGEPIHVARQMERKLHALGVSTYYGKSIKRVSKQKITLSNESVIPYDLFIWAGGGHASSLLQEVGFETDTSGRVTTLPTLQARGFSRVYVAGDNARFSVTKRQTLSPSIAYATSQGAHVAQNIARQIMNKPLKRYQPPANPRAYNFGNYSGLLPIGPFIIESKIALLLKNVLVFDYLLNILSLSQLYRRNKLVTATAILRDIGRQ